MVKFLQLILQGGETAVIVENGNWIMEGPDPSDPDCIHTVDELEKYIEKIGFLPLFAGEVPGFSVEERTDPASWWSDDPERDPWLWREIIARRGKIAYGKFFNNKAGFVTKEWFGPFANYRRDGYDFDARWDDELASIRQKKLMDRFAGDRKDREILSGSLKAEAGFGRGGEKNFDGVLTQLQMMAYLVCRDFRQRENKQGKAYGWPMALICTPEHLFGNDAVTNCYREEPAESLKKLALQVLKFFPDAGTDQILKLLAFKEDRPKAGKNNAWPYPLNLYHAVCRDKDPNDLTDDQISGLFVALGQLQSKQQRVLRMKYLEGMTNEEIGIEMNRAAGTISTYHGKAMRRLRDPLNAAWYERGYAENLKACAAGEHWEYPESHPTDKISPDDYCLRIGLKVRIFESLARHGILTIADLSRVMDAPGWYRNIPGVGPKTAEDMQRKLQYFGFLT